MDQRERLINLIIAAVNGCSRHWAEVIADHLLANGVLVPPCKVGDDLWWVYSGDILDEGEGLHVDCEKNAIHGIVWDGKEFSVVDEAKDILEIGSEFACLSKEQAEQVMKEMEEGIYGNV